ncbi:phage head-tail connector protein [Aurantimonas marina]|uniref:phage head-tail connector protein n=1 Tax=Aurantimonas marina TaxID=2780508 RepID=UPI0038CC024C
MRIPAAATDAFDLVALKLHARIDADDEDAALELMGRTAANEIEAYCDLALLRQTIVLEIEAGNPVLLPVGPLATDAVVTIDGEPIIGAVTAGRYPVLTFPDDITGMAAITYEAGYGDTPADIPADLQLAVIDHAARMYDLRGASEGQQGLSIAAARICARHRQVRA